MDDIAPEGSPGDAEIRDRLAEYNDARRALKKIEQNKPGADAPQPIQDRFKKRAKAAAHSHQIARSALYDAVASSAGSPPCAVVVDAVGGSSVVVLPEQADDIIVIPAAHRVRIKDVVCRPEPPPEFANEYRQTAPNRNGAYLVMQGGDLVAIYNGVYVRSINEVVADFQALLRSGHEGLWSDDYVVWCEGRIMAVIHSPMDGRERKIILFNESRNDPIAGRDVQPMPYWPTFEQWVASGRGNLWKTDRYP
jgi:hypothetical protein